MTAYRRSIVINYDKVITSKLKYLLSSLQIIMGIRLPYGQKIIDG